MIMMKNMKITKNMRHLLKCFYAVACCILFYACSHTSNIQMADLKCESLVNPLAIDNTTPHFSWKMMTEDKGAFSTAYQILVATELGKLNKDSEFRK